MSYDTTVKDSDRIKADIDRTRCEMDETLDELGNRIRPAYWIGSAMGGMMNSRNHHANESDSVATRAAKAGANVIGNAAQNAAGHIGHAIKTHPLPSAMIGAGLLWWLARDTGAIDRLHESDSAEKLRRKAAGAAAATREGMHTAAGTVADGASRAGHAVSEGAGAVAGAVGSAGAAVAQGARSTTQAVGQGAAHAAGTVADGISTAAQTTGHQLAEGYEVTRDKAVKLFDEHPLLVGASVLAGAALLGAAIPTTRREDRAFGEYSDRLKAQAREQAATFIDKTAHVAEDTVDAALDEAEHQGLTPAQLKEKAAKVAVETKDTAKQSAREHGLKPQEETTATQTY